MKHDYRLRKKREKKPTQKTPHPATVDWGTLVTQSTVQPSFEQTDFSAAVNGTVELPHLFWATKPYWRIKLLWDAESDSPRVETTRRAWVTRGDRCVTCN